MKKRMAMFLAVFFCLFAAVPCLAASFYSSSPYVNSVARFIAGSKAKIGRGTFMALNEKELRRKGGKLLFRGTDMTADDMLRAYYDPAKLPYMAQAIMRVMSSTDKANYIYYQRRLAEFQAALDSAVNVGRYSLPKNVKMLDLTMAEGALIASASKNVTRPRESEWKRWQAGDTASLVRLIEMNEAKGAIILVDRWTPASVRSCTDGCKNKIVMPAVEGDSYFNSLNTIYRYTAKQINEVKNKANGEKKK